MGQGASDRTAEELLHDLVRALGRLAARRDHEAEELARRLGLDRIAPAAHEAPAERMMSELKGLFRH